MRCLLLTLACSCLIQAGAAFGKDAPPVAVRRPIDAVGALGLEVEGEPGAWSIASVASGSPAARAGLLVGDRLTRLASKPIGAAYADAVGAAIQAAREAPSDAVQLVFDLKREGAAISITLSVSLAEIDVTVAAIRALDFLADELARDPKYGQSRPRAYYAPIIYAPLAGLAFASSGSTRRSGRHAQALRTVLAYVMIHGGVRKEQQDAINKAVGGNICSLTHNAGFSAMFLAQLIDAESSDRGAKTRGKSLQVSDTALRKKLRVCCKTLEELQLENGGWQHGSGGANMLGYTHLMAATVTAMNGLAMAKQVGVKVRRRTIERGLAYIRKSTADGRVGYALGNAGSFSAGRNAAVLQIFERLGLHADPLRKPVADLLAKHIGKAGTGHGSPVWHLFYAGLESARLAPSVRADFDTRFRARLLAEQSPEGAFVAPEPAGAKPGSGEENRVWGALYTTPLIAMALLAPYRPAALLNRFKTSRR